MVTKLKNGIITTLEEIPPIKQPEKDIRQPYISPTHVEELIEQNNEVIEHSKQT